MLYIIYGLTTVVGQESREYFLSRDIRVIEKLTYETPQARIQPSTGILRRAENDDQVRVCVYVYENHGRIVGFSAEQIAFEDLRAEQFVCFSADADEFYITLLDRLAKEAGFVPKISCLGTSIRTSGSFSETV